MKKIFTLCIGAMMFFKSPVFSQINEQFENDSSTLAANCWQFLGVNFSKTPGVSASFVINGIASLYSLPPVTGDSIRIMRTPLLNVNNSINVSFKYRLNNTLSGQQTRRIQLALTTPVGVVVQSLATINMDKNTNNTTATISFNQTFAVTTPGTYRLAIITSGSTGGGNARISFDDFSQNAAVIGCDMQALTLPVELINFGGNLSNNKVNLNWAVAQNEDADYFEVQKSTDGKEFVTAAVVMPSSKSGSESYSLYSDMIKSEKVYYRLKVLDKNTTINFSKTLVFETKTIVNTGGLRIVNNPTTDKLSLKVTSEGDRSLDIRVYDLSGRMQMNQKVNGYRGINLISLPLTSLKTGMYAVEITNGQERLTSKFVKQ